MIKGVKLDLTPAIVEYAKNKIGSLEKFILNTEKQGEAVVIVEIARTTKHHHQGEVYYAEANLNLGGTMLRAEYIDEDIRSAIDKMKDVLKLEIKKHKEKTGKRRDILRKLKRAGE